MPRSSFEIPRSEEDNFSLDLTIFLIPQGRGSEGREEIRRVGEA